MHKLIIGYGTATARHTMRFSQIQSPPVLQLICSIRDGVHLNGLQQTAFSSFLQFVCM